MKRVPHISTLFFLGLLLPLLSSCKKEFQNDNFVAYFGGEVTNPNNRFVLFCKNNEVIDTIHLNKDNTFFKSKIVERNCGLKLSLVYNLFKR